MRSLVLISLAAILSNTAFATTCQVKVPSDLNAPFSFDKLLWSGTGDLMPGQNLIVSKDLRTATSISGDESFDKEFLSKHDGEIAINLGKPFPADRVAGDQLMSVSTIDINEPYFWRQWMNTVGNTGGGPSQYGLTLTDISRHINISCR